MQELDQFLIKNRQNNGKTQKYKYNKIQLRK